MKIALCSRGVFSLEKGSTKNRIELGQALREFGWESFLINLEDLGISLQESRNETIHAEALKNFLLKNSAKFDVVLYEYDTLPFDRTIFCRKTLFVARPAILAYHIPMIRFKYDLKTRLSLILKNLKIILSGQKREFENKLKHIGYCLEQADVIQVQNNKDRQLLLSKGFSPHKIIVVPNGIDSKRLKIFNDQSGKKGELTLAYVGTFDFRKGAMDFTYIFSALKKIFPKLRLKLLGTRGLFYSQDEVLDFFPKRFRYDIEVVPIFKAAELPGLLQDCDAGIFPSYLESFGFGALEMMGAGLPVVAYDAPGPSDFILPELLVPTGEKRQMVQKMALILQDKGLLEKLSLKAKAQVKMKYSWSQVAKEVDAHYHNHLKILRKSGFKNLV